MKNLHLVGLVLTLGFTPSVQADLILNVENVSVLEGITTARIGVRVSGPDRINNMTLAFGLGDGGDVAGGTERARIVGFSLDQTIWDTNPSVGLVSTPQLGAATPVPALPSAATTLNLPGASLTSSVDANGYVAFFDVDIASRQDRSPLRLDANFFNFTVIQGANQTPISFTSSTGMLTAVPEPSSALVGLLGWLAMARRRRRQGAMHQLAGDVITAKTN